MLRLARFHAQRQPSLGELTTTRTVCISKVDIFASNSILYNKCADEKLTAVELLAAGRPAAGQRVNGKKVTMPARQTQGYKQVEIDQSDFSRLNIIQSQT